MIKRLLPGAALAAVLLLGGCAQFPEFPPMFPETDTIPEESMAPRAAVANITDIRTELGERRKTITVVADAPFEYIAYMLEKPRRLAVEISGSKSAVATPSITVDDRLIKRISVIDFDKAGSVRIEIWLSGKAEYELATGENRLDVSLVPPPEERNTEELAQRLIESREEVGRLSRENGELAGRIEELSAALERSEETMAALEDRLAKLRDQAGAEPEEPSREEDVAEEPVPAPEDMGGAAKMAISEAVGQWRSAWQDMDYDRYISFYSASFVPDNGTREGWLESKRKKFRRAGDISVDIENLKIEVSDEKAVVQFIQRYRSDVYSDVGVKTLGMEKTGEGWKIEFEAWAAADM